MMTLLASMSSPKVIEMVETTIEAELITREKLVTTRMETASTRTMAKTNGGMMANPKTAIIRAKTRIMTIRAKTRTTDRKSVV